MVGKCYLVAARGPMDRTIYFLRDRLTIGRSPLNDIYLPENDVSPRHAVVRLGGDVPVVEDLKSDSGTHLNGQRIQRAMLSDGDTLRFGKTILRFMRQEVPADETSLSETARGARYGDKWGFLTGFGTSLRLNEAISKVALFASLDFEGRRQVAEMGRLVFYDAEKTICHRGDKDKSLYIILDGKVRVSILDHKERKVPISFLSENEFFGEVSFLRGTPRHATVEAVENSLLFELDADALCEITYEWPAVRTTLLEYCESRLLETEGKNRELGISERRQNPRFNVTVPVSFSVVEDPRLPERVRRTVFRYLSKDLSVSGVRLRVKERELPPIPVGSNVRVEIALPPPWAPVRCTAALRDMTDRLKGQPSGFMGMEFLDLPEQGRISIQRFLSS